jgi:hypothetical protein
MRWLRSTGLYVRLRLNSTPGRRTVAHPHGVGLLIGDDCAGDDAARHRDESRLGGCEIEANDVRTGRKPETLETVCPELDYHIVRRTDATGSLSYLPGLGVDLCDCLGPGPVQQPDGLVVRGQGQVASPLVLNGFDTS